MTDTSQVRLPVCLARLKPPNIQDNRRTHSIGLRHPVIPGKKLHLKVGDHGYDGGWYVFHDDEHGHEIAEFLRTRGKHVPSEPVEAIHDIDSYRYDEATLCDVVHIPPDGHVKPVDPRTGRRRGQAIDLDRTPIAYFDYLKSRAAVFEARAPTKGRTVADRGHYMQPYNLRLEDHNPDPKPPTDRISAIGDAVAGLADRIDSKDAIAQLQSQFAELQRSNDLAFESKFAELQRHNEQANQEREAEMDELKRENAELKAASQQSVAVADTHEVQQEVSSSEDKLLAVGAQPDAQLTIPDKKPPRKPADKKPPKAPRKASKPKAT